MNLFKAHGSPRYWRQNSPCPEGNGCLVTAGFSESSLCPWLLSDTPRASPASCCAFHLGPPASEGTLVQRSLPLGRRVMIRVLVPGVGLDGTLPSHMGSLAGGRLFLEIHGVFRSGLR